MQTNEQMLSAIENYLAQTEFPAEPELLYAPIGYSLAGGGKRLRPMLLTLSCAEAITMSAVPINVLEMVTIKEVPRSPTSRNAI